MKISLDARIVGPQAITEGETPDGSRWGVVIIQAGMSKNRNRYQRSVLEAAAGKYDGAHVYWDHSETGGPRSARDIAGFISNVATSESDGAFALTGTLNVTHADLREGLLEATRLGKPDLYGLSHDARARTSIVQVPGIGAVRDVLEIEDVQSVDVVSRPAAGGRVVRIAAGEGAVSAVSEKELHMFDQLVEQLKTLRPGVQIKEGITEAELVSLVIEAMKTAPAATDAPPAPVAAPVAVSGSLTEADRSMLREALLDRAFTGRTLPETVAARVRAELADITSRPALTLAEAQAVIDGWVTTLAPLHDVARGSGNGSTVQMGESEGKKKLDALDGLLDGEPVNGQKFRGIREAYTAITGDTDVTGYVRDCKGLREVDYSRVNEAITTSTFAEILGDSIRRRMVREYNTNPLYSDWRWITDVTSASDFRTNRRTRMGGYGNLPGVAEAAAYPALTSPADEEATYAVTKRGGVESITWETIKNDDMGAIRRIPGKLALAAGRTLYEFVFDFIKNNAVIYDGVALFAAAHNNIGATALNATSFAAARSAMLVQAEPGSSARIGLITRHLLVPAELEETAFDLFVRNTNNDETFVQSRKPRVHVSPYFTDANNWYAFADKAQVPIIEVAFLDGREDPDLIWQESQTEGTVFTNDQLKLKVRHVYGGNVLDYRGTYGAIVI